MRRLCAAACDRSGATAVEFAILFPVLAVVAIGTAAFGLALNNYIVLTEAVRDGARQLALSRGAASPYTTALSAVKTAASDLVQTDLTISTSVNGAACSTDSDCQTALANAAGMSASVKATYPCNLYVFGVDFAPGCTLSSTMTVMIE